MAEASKETIYIDIDDEITTIIEKLRTSKHKIVALVLPKRAAVLQSIVNMKLLKRAAAQNKKSIVLITSEAGLLPLAGSVGLHVAKTLTSKPAIPALPKHAEPDIDVDDTEAVESDEPELDTAQPVGELAGIPDDEEPIDVDASEPEQSEEEKTTKGIKDKKLKIPNFEKFRVRLILAGVALIALIIGWYVAFFVMPTASVAIKTDNQSVTVDMPFIASVSAKTLDQAKAIVPATNKESKKTDTEKVQATGKKDVGDQASGSVTLSLKDCSKDAVTIPAGTGVSSNGLTFVTQENVMLNSVKIGSVCKNDSFPSFSSGKVTVKAQTGGDNYNLSERDYAVTGFSNIGAHGTSMTGGTSKLVTIVSQDDVNNAKNKLADRSKDAAKKELTDGSKADNLFSLTETFSGSDPVITTSPNVGDESSDVSVTSVTTYSMLAVKRDDLKTLVVTLANKQIDTSKQAISNDGLDQGVFRLNDKGDGKTQKLNVQTSAETGTHIDQDALKKQLTGKKSGDIQQLVQAYPGVKEVTVHFSPFWVDKAPSKTTKITVTIEQVKGNGSN